MRSNSWRVGSCQDQRRLPESSSSAATDSGRTARTVNLRIAFTKTTLWVTGRRRGKSVQRPAEITRYGRGVAKTVKPAIAGPEATRVAGAPSHIGRIPILDPVS